MKPSGSAIPLLFVTLITAGCGTSGYMEDRRRDAADIFTFTLGKGGLFSARVGPLHLGLYTGHDKKGLRCGEFVRDTSNTHYRSAPQDVGGSFTFDPLIIAPPGAGGGPWIFGSDVFFGWETIGDPKKRDFVSTRRGKMHDARGVCPFVMLPRETYARYPVHYLTQVEVAVGFIRTVPVGFNPGELLDFILGWTTFDLYGDDIMREREKAQLGATRDQRH